MKPSRYKELRKANNLTQEEFCDRFKMKLTTYRSYEQGVTPPPLPVLEAMADFYHVTTDYLLGRSDIPWPYTTGDTQGGMTFTVPNAKKPTSEEAGNKTVTVSLDASPFRERLETALLREYIRKVVAEELAKAQQEK